MNTTFGSKDPWFFRQKVSFVPKTKAVPATGCV
jgi:hypothetical protein